MGVLPNANYGINVAKVSSVVLVRGTIVLQSLSLTLPTTSWWMANAHTLIDLIKLHPNGPINFAKWCAMMQREDSTQVYNFRG